MSLPKNIDPSKSNPDPGAVVLHDESPTTCCATITGKGRSAIAVVAIRGSSSRDLLSQCFEGATKGRFSPGEIRYGVWIGRTLQQDPQDECATAESVVITPLDENHFEIHCHGGPAAIGRIMEDLQSLGATAVQRDEWPPSSEILLVNEATVVLARCVTARTAAIAMDQVRGALLNWAKRLLASLEHDKISTYDVKCQAERIVGFAEFTTRMAEPFRVVLLGPPNVGKSSLLNAIVGFDRSITLDAAGTTRDVLHADTVIDGLPIRLSDTAGIRDSDETIEQLGMGRARNAAAAADLVLGVTEPALAGRGDELELDSSRPLIRVLNKADLLADHDSDHGCEITTNALSGEGVEGLLSRIASRLGRSMPPPSEPAPINDRQAERLRELSRAGNAAHSAAILRELIGVSDASGVQR